MSIPQQFRALVAAPGMVLAPGAYDALSARIIEAEGFTALCAGGFAAIGSMLAQPDTGQCSMRDYADHYERICSAVSIPVFVDGDTGFGGVNNVREMVRAFESAGVAGLFFGDQVFPQRCGYMEGKQIVPVEEMLAKIRAALAARRDPEMMIAARTDALAVEGLEGAIRRARLYRAAGADMAMVIGTDRIEDYKRVRAEVSGPQFANVSHANPRGSAALAEYRAAGAELVTFPSATLFAAAGAVRRTLSALNRDLSFINVADDLMPLSDYYEIVGFEAQKKMESKLAAEASALIASNPG